MNITTKTYQEIVEDLKEIIFSNICKETKRKTLDILLKLTSANILKSVNVLGYDIDALTYENVIGYMMKEQKIKAIKVIREKYPLIINLRKAKEMVEEISHIEKIQMNNGYQG